MARAKAPSVRARLALHARRVNSPKAVAALPEHYFVQAFQRLRIGLV
jgi:hypothetical protein